MKESASIDLTGRSAPLQVGKEALLLIIAFARHRVYLCSAYLMCSEKDGIAGDERGLLAAGRGAAARSREGGRSTYHLASPN
jgi:hypothetical protein